MAYPISIKLKAPKKSSRWLAFAGLLMPLKLIYMLPVLIVAGAISSLGAAAAMVNAFYVLWKGKRHPVLMEYVEGSIRLAKLQVGAYILSLTDEYPGFDYREGKYPVQCSFSSKKSASKGWALLTILMPIKFLAILPHLLIVIVWGFLAFIAALIAYIAIIFTGRYPKRMAEFQIKLLRYTIRLNGFLFGVTDEYPPVGCWN